MEKDSKTHKTTLNLPPEVWKKLKLKAVEKDLTVTDALIEAIESWAKK